MKKNKKPHWKYRIDPQAGFNFEEMTIDNFAGGGGASTGIEAALGRPVDVAINHDDQAISMHEINHPNTKHYCESVWDIDPIKVTDGRPVGIAWFSPDCKHFSKAKGKKPVSKKIRGLAWVALRWAAKVKPRIIMLENVEEFVTWGPLITVDNGDQVPCPKRKGQTFKSFVNALKKHGYDVEWKELRACDYGAPTIRKRLFLIARRDGLPIVWPKKTHGNPESYEVKSGKLKPWKIAAECIDWSIPCPSIFERKKPLAENTMRRIAKGIQRFVIDAAQPFIVTCNHSGDHFRGQGLGKPFNTVLASRDAHGLVQPILKPHKPSWKEWIKATKDLGGTREEYDRLYGDDSWHLDSTMVTPFITEHANASNQRNMPTDEPLRTVCAEVKGGHFAVVAPVIARQFGKSVGHPLTDPSGSITAGGGGKSQLVAAFLAKHFGGNYTGPGADLSQPAHTVTTVDHHALVTSNMIKLRGTCKDGQPVTEPMPTITAGGTHVGEVRAFLLKYYGTNIGHQVTEPLQTVTTKHRFGLVMVHGEPYEIVDIGMRMLEPHELFAAQGFPADYIHDRTADGKKLSKAAQVRMCGNSVCPPLAEALVRANNYNAESVYLTA